MEDSSVTSEDSAESVTTDEEVVGAEEVEGAEEVAVAGDSEAVSEDALDEALSGDTEVSEFLEVVESDLASDLAGESDALDEASKVAEDRVSRLGTCDSLDPSVTEILVSDFSTSTVSVKSTVSVVSAAGSATDASSSDERSNS